MALTEPYRPQFHFTPPDKWLNDPNGLLYYQGEYHLFYQYHPDSTVWGPMHWGHAVSRDLVNWQHLPVALYPDENGMIFSGSGVIDWHNTAGFGQEAMVAIFTHHDNDRQMQSIAYSNDKGRTWQKYAGNPVIEPPAGMKDFRDPKVFWHDKGDGTGHWVMSLAAGHTILFYTSPDLKQWQPSGRFGPDIGATCGVWETPDLFKLPVDGGPDSRWVLSVGIGDCAPAGGSGMQYFVGDFDGKTFTSENPKETILWADYGADFYAAQSWSDVADGRRLWIAWMSNWTYAREIPTSTWRGAFSLPRQLTLAQTPKGIRLVQQPAVELQQLRRRHWEWQGEVCQDATRSLPEVSGELLEIVAEFQVDESSSTDCFGVQVRVGEGEQTTIGYAVQDRSLFVDRSQSGQTAFHVGFPAVHTAEMHPLEDCIRLHIFVDRSSVELFGNDGQVQFSERIFPARDSLGVVLYASGGPVRVNSLHIYRLEAATFQVLV